MLNLEGDKIMTGCRSIQGVKFCEYEDDVNRWIKENPDKKVLDVKVTSTYNYHREIDIVGFLILWAHE
jgi:hypothetical protein